MSKIINLNGTTPAANPGYTLGIWQESATPSGTDPTTGEPYYDVSVEFQTPTPISEVPAGTMNGANTVFTLSYTPIAGTLILTLNGVVQNPNGDFTISGATITYTTAPQSTDWQNAWYWH